MIRWKVHHFLCLESIGGLTQLMMHGMVGLLLGTLQIKSDIIMRLIPMIIMHRIHLMFLFEINKIMPQVISLRQPRFYKRTYAIF